jgi:hypothetical protein
LIGIGIGAGLLALVIVPVAFASTLADVVPRLDNEQLYRYWMTRTWELYFTAPRLAPCQTVQGPNGKPVTIVENFRGNATASCTVPAGQEIYINEYTTHCSTIPGDHPGFPDSSANDLETCSRGIDGATTKVLISVWLDGRNVPKFGNYYWRGTLAFTAKLAANRFKGVADRQITAAAWGWSLLLARLPKGRHTVYCRVLHPVTRRLKTKSLITLRVR